MRRHGYTLIELLVTVAIIAIVIGLLLPSIQKVRSASARIHCANNLHQFGIAVHNFYNTYERLPTAGIAKQSHPDDKSGWGWQIRIFHDESGKLHHCPAKPGPRRWIGFDTGTLDAMTDYAGADSFHLGAISRMYNGRIDSVKFDMLTKGSSNTLIIAEKRLNIAQAAIARNHDDDCGRYCGNDHDIMRTTVFSPQPDFVGKVGNATWPIGHSTEHGMGLFGASHPNGLNTLKCDGSVEFVNYNIDSTIWYNSGKR